MSVLSLKRIRLIAALVLFFTALFYFTGSFQLLPENVFSWITDIQFIPALLLVFKGSIVAILILAAIIILTLLFGRVYCSTICPLGIYQDVVIRFKKWIVKNVRFKYKKGSPLIHYSVSALVFILFFTGITAALILLDPYSNFGRMAADTFKVPFIHLNNLSSRILQGMGIYNLNPVNYKVAFLSLIYATAFTIIISILAWWRGRFFCNYICPVGGVLSILARFSFFKLKINEASCTSCGLCLHNCKAECINIKEKTIDSSRCINCYNCINTCTNQGIDYVFSTVKLNKRDTQKEASNRRQVFSKSIGLGLGLISLPALAQYPKEENSEDVVHWEHRGKSHGGINYSDKGIVTPPGSYSLEHFNDNCTACHLCVAKCPSNVIQPTFSEYGLANMLQPKMDYNLSYCNFNCTVCGDVCPTGAIVPLSQEEKHVCQLGKVNFARNYCVVVTEGTSCGSCSEHCPTQAVHMVPFGDNLTIPVINPDICIGCGACEYACPVQVPHKAIFVVANTLHQVADKPKVDEVEFNTEEDFPF